MTGGTDREAHRADLSGGPVEPAGTSGSAAGSPDDPIGAVDEATRPGDLGEDGGSAGGAGGDAIRPGGALGEDGGSAGAAVGDDGGRAGAAGAAVGQDGGSAGAAGGAVGGAAGGAVGEDGGHARAGGAGVGGAAGAAGGAGGEDGGGADDAGRRAKDPDRGYLIAATVMKPLMRAWFRIRLEGSEHIPAGGPVILASNHRSNMDPVLLASAVDRPLAFMAKAELFVGPLGWILRWIGQFPVRRGGIDREALRRTDAVLARGSMLGLFPEGTRGDGGFAAVHPGLAYIVVRQRCPVLPVVIFGTDRVRRRFGWLPFASPVRIVIGPPIDLPRSTSDRAGRRAASEILRQRLQAFLATVGGTPTNPTPNRQSDE
jgi:1-acyl-sn-glycerol-3-phosphate acyltransferase